MGRCDTGVMWAQALREGEREKARASLADKQRLDIEYLKNTILKLYETGALPNPDGQTARHRSTSLQRQQACRQISCRSKQNWPHRSGSMSRAEACRLMFALSPRVMAAQARRPLYFLQFPCCCTSALQRSSAARMRWPAKQRAARTVPLPNLRRLRRARHRPTWQDGPAGLLGRASSRAGSKALSDCCSAARS